MLVNGKRRCDFCQREIVKGERYVVRRIDRSEIPPNFTVTDMTLDESGQIRFDICRDCQNRMRLSGEPSVD